ncbi:MAG: Flp pilus assembly complex ATPase component TadA [Candidatus Omnitrophica bacterium]|nr:Flp pilus assembly complex ATPase component TadA [Candidatus Omnitrophota bacterium]
MSSFKERISTVLLSRQIATKEQLDRLIAESSRNGRGFARMLIERKIISEATLTELLSKEFAIPMISLAKYRLDPVVAKLIPERLARQYNLIALSRFGERLVVAMADPLNIFAIDDLKALTQVAIDPVLCTETEIRRAIEQLYASQTLTTGLPDAAEETAGQGEDDLTMDTAVALLLNETGETEAPVIRIINRMVIESMRRHASDIHLEPGKDALRVRYRIDGRLVEAHRLPKAVQSALLTRLKIMSGLDITEWRLPQDGRFKVRLDEREVDFRVSVLPMAGGGKVVLRLLDQANLSVGLDHLGFLPESIEQFKAAVKRPYGMILVTGPTGSGKSTTLYSILNQLNQPTKNLLTIEDPVEYQVEGIIQMQVNVEVGLTFASGLRAILRQSPDVIMIGEIRDFETADIAMKASLTGQLVLSTLHTNDAPSAVTRLIDMGVEPFLVASSVNLIQAQRLVRKLCTKCREPFDPSPALLERLSLHPAKDATFFKAVGCRFCTNTGYRGRMGIIETFQVDDRVRELIVSRAQSWEIKDHAIKELGMTPLRQDGLKKAERGVTTLEEVIAVTSDE